VTTIAVAIVGRAITIWEAIQKEAMNQSTKLIQKLKERDYLYCNKNLMIYVKVSVPLRRALPELSD
jgi:hypothetical protein